MFEFAALGGCCITKEIALLTCFVFAGQSIYSGKFKHLKNSENVNFAGTNNADSIFDRLKGFAQTLGQPKIPKGSKRIQRNRKKSNRFQKIAKYSKIMQKNPKEL